MPEMPNIDVRPDLWRIVRNILQKHVPQHEVWAFGSRVKWTAKEYSDLDLAIITDKPLSFSTSAALREDFSESDLPWRVDFLDWATTSESFREVVARDKVVVQTARQCSVMISAWRKTTWGEEITLEYGKAIRGYQEARGKFRVFGSNGPIGWTDNALADGPGVILGRKGAYRGVQFSHEPFWVIDTAYFVVPKNDLDMRWLYYAIKHYKLGEIDDGSPIPSTTRTAVYVKELMVPSLKEQRAIAHILGTLDDRIANLRQTNATLEAIAAALFKSRFVDFDGVLPDEMQESELGLIPKGWYKKSIGECFFLIMGQSPPGNTYNDRGDGLPFFQGRKDFRFRYPENRTYCSQPTRTASAEDTLISVRAPVGDINLAWEKCCIGRGVAAIRHRSGSRSFTYYAMLTQQERLKQFEYTGTVFGSINKKQFEELSFVEPDLSIIEAYEHSAKPLDDAIRNNIAQSAALAQLRDTLLPHLISGQIQVNQ